MSKILKFGLGLAAGAAVGAALYASYRKSEDDLRLELVGAVRTHFAGRDIDVVWLFDEPARVGIFKGGLIVKGSVAADETSIEFEVEEKSLVVHELKSEVLS